MSESKIKTQNNPVTPEGAQIDRTRRKFAGAGLAGSGVLLTLASRPVLANTVCLAPSGFQSGNLSQPNQGYTPCGGRTPGYWGQKNSIDQGSWDAAGCKPGVCDSTSGNCNSCDGWYDTKNNVATKFWDTFPCNGYLSRYRYLPNSYPQKKLSLMQCIHLDGSQDPYQLGAHLCAAYLNAKSGMNVMPSVAVVLAIASEYDATGKYSPIAGVDWSGPDIVTYLKSTMPL